MNIQTSVIDEMDLPGVDEFLRRTFYKDEPLITTNSVQFWEKGLHFSLAPLRLSVKTVDLETNEIIGVAVNDPASQNPIYNALPEDKKDKMNQYLLEVAGPKEVRAVHEFFLDTLYLEEPLIAANRPEKLPRVVGSLTSSVVNQGISVVATEATSRRVVGAVLNDVPPQEFEYIYTRDDEDKKVMFDHIERASKVLQVAPDAVEVRFLAVDAAFRGRGVAQSLIQASVAVARQAGFRWAKIYCTSAFTDCLMRKLGWTKLYSQSYKEYVAEYNSDIKVPEEPHTHCHLYICDLTVGVS